MLTSVIVDQISYVTRKDEFVIEMITNIIC